MHTLLVDRRPVYLYDCFTSIFVLFVTHGGQFGPLCQRLWVTGARKVVAWQAGGSRSAVRITVVVRVRSLGMYFCGEVLRKAQAADI